MDTAPWIIVIGLSAGGLMPLQTILQSLPAGMPAALFVAQHQPATSETMLPEILRQAGPFLTHLASDGLPITVGHLYVAPPDQHLIVEQGHIHTVRGPKENGFRPAIDVLFRTAARVYTTRVVGVLLAGLLDDGTAGLLAIKRHGGVALVQDPTEAAYASMPSTAIRYVAVDGVYRAHDLAAQLLGVMGNGPPPAGMNEPGGRINLEAGIAAMSQTGLEQADVFGNAVPLSCPECRGVLSAYYDGSLLRFRCQTGHAYSQESLVAGHGELLDRTLWAALTALNERILLAQRLVHDARRFQDAAAERRFGQLMLQATVQKEQLRQLMLLPDRPLRQSPTDREPNESLG